MPSARRLLSRHFSTVIVCLALCLLGLATVSWSQLAAELPATEAVPIAVTAQAAAAAETDSLVTLPLRRQVRLPGEAPVFRTTTEPARWDLRETAVIVCDMWDRHWCEPSTQRVGEMAPRMNDVLRSARSRGALIIHCPSDTMEYYEGTAGRQLARSAPQVKTEVPLERWRRLDPQREAALPIDDSDGGCDCDPPVTNFRAWSRQIADLEILPGDAITDSAEAYFLMRQRGIRHVLVMGVHTNMCVLGRPFSIRQLVLQGLDVALVRDLTDTMYNPAKSPFVSHFTGTDLVVEHIERYWCPSITSADLIGGQPFRFAADQRPHLVLLIGETEYRTAETLPPFAIQELGRDFRITTVIQDPATPGDLPGIEAVNEADVVLLSLRRRPLPPAQLDVIRRYLAAGKPLVGIRTASHPFHLRDQPPPAGLADWPTFDREILSGNYQGHFGHDKPTRIEFRAGAVTHPILAGLQLDPFTVQGGLYQNHRLPAGPVVIAEGRIEGRIEPEPVAWTWQRPDGGRTFYTSIGDPSAFQLPLFRRFLAHGVLWAAGLLQESAAQARSTEPAPAEFRSTSAQPATSLPLPGPAVSSTTALLQSPSIATPANRWQQFEQDWQSITVPGVWDGQAGGALDEFDGVAWYRCAVAVPDSWANRDAQLLVEQIDNSSMSFVNGTKVGVSGGFPPQYQSGLGNAHRYHVPATLLVAGQTNHIAIRVYDRDGRGGFKGRAPLLISGSEAIDTTGLWELRIEPAGQDRSTDASWTNAISPGRQPFASLTPAPAQQTFETFIRRAQQSTPVSPQEAVSQLQTPPDLSVELVLSEPEITQPLFLNFDERGRLWLLEYRQYPEPAGLTLLSKDKFWRAVYDKVPPPPPEGPAGADRISIHEDTDGDGTLDRHTVFLDGLNIATSFAQGRGGVWVLNPPYLLFYPDRNHDDIPDGPPEVHLSGFGLEDTHSVVNSLRFGPDGWLYAAQGSTVSAAVKRPGVDKQPRHSQGQHIWRYHPERREYEIFAEGGGNAFGVEVDAAGEIFSGHNGGNTHGFHYPQAGYLQKGFGKHGPLSNPYAFGYFKEMPHHDYNRFTHTFTIYEGHTLPAAYQGRLFGVNPLQNHVVIAELTASGSSYATRDTGFAITSTDSWFKPVDIKDGPDGCLYVADWYDGQLAHTANYQGGMDRERGRVYRLKPRAATGPLSPRIDDLSQLPTIELCRLISHPNRWQRQQALRLLGDRGAAGSVSPAEIEPLLTVFGQNDPRAVDALWALFAVQQLSPERAAHALNHPQATVRAWAVRLLTDSRRVESDLRSLIVKLSTSESDPRVLVQLASSAQRMPADTAIAVINGLLRQPQLATDGRLPLLVWWAIERHCDSHRAEILQLWAEPEIELGAALLWSSPAVQKEILPRLMRRFAVTGQRADLNVCAQLLAWSPEPAATKALVTGFEEAYQGRSLTNLPPTLLDALAASGGGSLMLRIRQRDAAAVTEGLAALRDESISIERRAELAKVFSEVRIADALPVFLELLRTSRDELMIAAVLQAAGAFADESIASVTIDRYPQWTADVQSVAQSLLASRRPWAKAFVAAIQTQRIDSRTIPSETVRALRELRDPDLDQQLTAVWGPLGARSSETLDADGKAELDRLLALLGEQGGNPYAGKPLYAQLCGKCHMLHATGGRIGPDLTTYKRDDLRALLLQIVHPSGEIREGYETLTAILTDGRVVTGFLVDQDPQVVSLKTVDGQAVAMERSEIEELIPQRRSLMPEGLLKSLSEAQLQDLFAYLRTGQPLAD